MKNLRLLSATLLAVFLFNLQGCTQEDQARVPVYDPTKPFSYRDNRLQPAWENNDSSFVRSWIINSDTLSFTHFADVMADFAGTTNFTCGLLDVEGTIDSRFTAREKEVLTKNIHAINLIYVHSCLFMDKKIDSDSCLSICDKFPLLPESLTRSELQQIKVELRRFAFEMQQMGFKRGI